jgi:phenylpropionate dioxygenase-like ring-hydroxylating dioxygenase large terminal subunit
MTSRASESRLRKRPVAEALPWPMADHARGWWLAAASASLRGERPLARTVLGRRLVLFRDGGGVARALDDRCLHRSVSLSLGQVREGCIECPYHGWRFDGLGACTKVPSACDEPLPKGRIGAVPVHEAEGSIWLWAGEGVPDERPSWPFLARAPHRIAELETELACPLLQVVDNFVDCAHTGFVHRGLFRGEPSRRVRACVREVDLGVHIETFGETDTDSLIAKVLVPKGEAIVHTDEVLLPHTVRVTYRFGERSIVTISTSTPIDAEQTRVFTRLQVDFGVLTQPVLAALVPMTRKILDQDRVVLDDQGEQLRRHGKRFGASCKSDAATAFVSRAYEAWLRGEFPPAELRSREVEVLL